MRTTTASENEDLSWTVTVDPGGHLSGSTDNWSIGGWIMIALVFSAVYVLIAKTSPDEIYLRAIGGLSLVAILLCSLYSSSVVRRVSFSRAGLAFSVVGFRTFWSSGLHQEIVVPWHEVAHIGRVVERMHSEEGGGVWYGLAINFVRPMPMLGTKHTIHMNSDSESIDWELAAQGFLAASPPIAGARFALNGDSEAR